MVQTCSSQILEHWPSGPSLWIEGMCNPHEGNRAASCVMHSVNPFQIISIFQSTLYLTQSTSTLPPTDASGSAAETACERYRFGTAWCRRQATTELRLYSQLPTQRIQHGNKTYAIRVLHISPLFLQAAENHQLHRKIGLKLTVHNQNTQMITTWKTTLASLTSVGNKLWSVGL